MSCSVYVIFSVFSTPTLCELSDAFLISDVFRVTRMMLMFMHCSYFLAFCELFVCFIVGFERQIGNE